MSGQVLLRVKYDLYEYYINHLTKPERDYVLSVLKAVFAKLIEEVRQKKEAGQPVKAEEKKEYTIVVEHKPPESDVLRIYKKYEALQKELESRLVELEELREAKRAAELEREKCLKELESLRRRPDELQRELQRKDQMARELADLASLVAYCLDTGECDTAKLRDTLRLRLSRLGVQPTKPHDALLAVVRKLPK